MKKTFFALLLLCAFSAGSVFAQSLDEILQKYYSAVNQEKLSEVKTLSSSGKFLMMGMEMPITILQKRPGKVRVDGSFQGTSFVSTYNGEQGWSLNPFMGQTEPQPMSPDELKSTKDQADIDGYLFDYEKKGYKLELMPDELMDSAKVHVIKVTKADSSLVHVYLDTESGYLVKTKMKTVVQGAESEVESIMSNFKTVDGIVMPFAIENRVNGSAMMNIVVDKVEVDKDIDDALFEKPVTK